MSVYKTLLNEEIEKCSSLKMLDKHELAALKKCMLDIYRILADFCEKHNLTIMLAGGSCLGAVRHKGYIPWDDDLDVMMPRYDYDKLIDYLEKGELSDKLEFTCPSKFHDSPNIWLKLYMKETRFVELGQENSLFPKGVKIDVFALDGTPTPGVKLKIKSFIANFLHIIANTVGNPIRKFTPTEKEIFFASPKLKNFVIFRLIFGAMFSFISHQKWAWWFDKFVSNGDMKRYVGIPTGRKLYGGEVFPTDVYFPPQKGLFEGETVNLPANTDAYLKNLYRNYMQLPPEDKREKHFVIEFSLPARYYLD